jgi:O-antigen/teichoic acid export membrane protein
MTADRRRDSTGRDASTGRRGGRLRAALAAWRSGKYKLWNDYAVLAGGQAGIKLLGLLAFAWLARVLDPVSYGAVEYVVGLTAVFATVVDAGLGTVGIRRAAHDAARLPVLAFQIQLARLLLALLSVPAMILIARSAAAVAGEGLLVALFAASLLTQPWRPEWLLQACERMTETAIARVLRTAVFLVGVLLLVRRPGDLALVGAAELAALVVMALYCLWVQQVRITPVRLTGPVQGLAPLAREGAVVGAGNLVWSLDQYAPLFLLGSFVGGAETAWYAAAARIVGALMVFGSIYHFSLYPTLTRAHARDGAELARLLAASLRITAWVGSLAALALATLATPILAVAFGPKLTAGAPALQLMAWILPVTLCSGQARWALTAAGAQSRVLAAQLAGLAATLAVVAVAGPRWGLLGYAAAALAGPIVVWIVAHRSATRMGSSPPSARLALKPVGLAIALFVLARAIDTGVVGSIALLAAYFAAAFVVDRRLLPDLAHLGAAKLGYVRSDKPEGPL